MGGKHGTIDIDDRGRDHKINDKSHGIEGGQKLDEQLNNKFDSYNSKLEVNDKKIKKINERRDVLEKILATELNINEKHIIGSYARETMVDSIDGNDIDIMIVIDDKKHGDWMKQKNGPSNCLQTVKRIIQKDPRFKNAEIHIDENAVTVKYHDFSIDIVPAFKDKHGDYKIPDTRGDQSWIKTNPRLFKKIMSASDRANNGRVSEIVKIAKGWNENNGKPLKSFHIETMVYTHFRNRSNSENKSISTDVKEFFARLPWYIRTSFKDPASGDRVDTYLTHNQREIAIRRAQKSVNRMKRAKQLAKEEKPYQSINEYEKIFGDKFV